MPCMRSWFLRSSSAAKVSSLILRSDLRRFFWPSLKRRFSASSPDSNSLILVSILFIAFLPPFNALLSASSNLDCISLPFPPTSLLHLPFHLDPHVGLSSLIQASSLP